MSFLKTQKKETVAAAENFLLISIGLSVSSKLQDCAAVPARTSSPRHVNIPSCLTLANCFAAKCGKQTWICKAGNCSPALQRPVGVFFTDCWHVPPRQLVGKVVVM